MLVLGPFYEGREKLLLAQVLDCSLEVGPIAVHSLLGEEVAEAHEEGECSEAEGNILDLPHDDAINHAVQDVVLFELGNPLNPLFLHDPLAVISNFLYESVPNLLQGAHFLVHPVLVGELSYTLRCLG